MNVRVGITLAMAAAMAAPAMAAAPDGFAAFWPTFAAAAAKDDAKALQSMTLMSAEFGDDAGSFAKLHKDLLGSAKRACLAKAKPKRDVDPQGKLSYYAFCGHEIYIFTKETGGWKFSSISPDD